MKQQGRKDCTRLIDRRSAQVVNTEEEEDHSQGSQINTLARRRRNQLLKGRILARIASTCEIVMSISLNMK